MITEEEEKLDCYQIMNVKSHNIHYYNSDATFSILTNKDNTNIMFDVEIHSYGDLFSQIQCKVSKQDLLNLAEFIKEEANKLP